MNEKPPYYIVSFSGGKDSTAMLLRLVEEHRPIDEIIFIDTGIEFPELYAHIDLVEERIKRKITRISSNQSFEFLLLEREIKRSKDSKVLAKYGDVKGHGWTTTQVRWCTNALKIMPKARYLSSLRKDFTIYEYLGIAADETKRLERKVNKNPNHIHPLVEWNMSEQDCLAYCYQHGFDWGGLYEKKKRVSCWACPLQNLNDLRYLYHERPELWEKLREWDSRCFNSFHPRDTLHDLEVRFSLEDRFLTEGKSTKNWEFFDTLRTL